MMILDPPSQTIEIPLYCKDCRECSIKERTCKLTNREIALFRRKCKLFVRKEQ